MNNPYPERRRWPRYSVVVECYIEGVAARAAARLTTLGMGGGYVDAKSPFDRGDSFGLSLILDGAEVQVNAQVVYLQDGTGFGFSFDMVDMPPATRHRIEQFLQRHAEQV